MRRLALLALVLLSIPVPLKAEEQPVQFKGWIYYGERDPSPHFQLFDSEQALGEFRKRIPTHRPTKKKLAPPNEDPLLEKRNIDFQKHLLVVVTRDQTLSAYPILKDIKETDDQILVTFSFPSPPPEAMPYGWGTYRAVLLPIQDKPYKITFD